MCESAILRTQEFDATARYKSQLVNAAISRVNSAGNVAQSLGGILLMNLQDTKMLTFQEQIIMLQLILLKTDCIHPL